MRWNPTSSIYQLNFVDLSEAELGAAEKHEEQPAVGGAGRHVVQRAEGRGGADSSAWHAGGGAAQGAAGHQRGGMARGAAGGPPSEERCGVGSCWPLEGRADAQHSTVGGARPAGRGMRRLRGAECHRRGRVVQVDS